MTLAQALKKILHNVPTGRVLVAEKDSQPYYATDRQALYVNADGSFTWVYESGCSCYTDTDETRITTIKEFRVELNKEWEDAVIRFAETGEVQDLYA